MAIEEQKIVYVAWKGNQPLVVAETEATASRLARSTGNFTHEFDVQEAKAYKVDGVWYVPGVIRTPNQDDIARQNEINARKAAIQKAKRLGMTNEELKTICGVS